MINCYSNISTMIKIIFRITGLDNKMDKFEIYFFKVFKTLREEIALGNDKDLFNNKIDNSSENDNF